MKNKNSLSSIIDVERLAYFYSKLKQEVIDVIFPPQSVILSYSSTNPATYLPGTSWTKLTAGNYLRAGNNTTSGGGQLWL